MNKIRFVSIGAAAQLLGCHPWKLLCLYERLTQQPVPRVRGYPVIPAEDLRRREEARDQGYPPGYGPAGEDWPGGIGPPGAN